MMPKQDKIQSPTEIKKRFKGQVNTWVVALRESSIKRNPAQTCYAAESPSPC